MFTGPGASIHADSPAIGTVIPCSGVPVVPPSVERVAIVDIHGVRTENPSGVGPHLVSTRDGSSQGSQKFPCKEDLIGSFVAKSFSPRVLTGRTCRETVGFSRIIEDLYNSQPNCTGQLPSLKRERAIRIYRETYRILGSCRNSPMLPNQVHVGDSS